jgi:predicted RNA-binding protein YlqC (UPF0109 family)
MYVRGRAAHSLGLLSGVAPAGTDAKRVTGRNGSAVKALRQPVDRKT